MTVWLWNKNRILTLLCFPFTITVDCMIAVCNVLSICTRYVTKYMRFKHDQKRIVEAEERIIAEEQRIEAQRQQDLKENVSRIFRQSEKIKRQKEIEAAAQQLMEEERRRETYRREDPDNYE